MDKTYHFLSGLPRSGNTLLSAILNQNPEIYSSPMSPIPYFMWELIQCSSQIEHTHRNEENKIRSEMFLSSFMDNFYKDVKKPIVIDRDKVWGTPANLELIKKYITPTPKIIFTVRNILDIIASFVKMDADYLKKEVSNNNYFLSNYRSEKDAIVEYLMAPNGNIDKTLLSLSSAFQSENKGIFHIVEYNNLVSNPEETLFNIYKFLELPNYEHDFSKIKKIELDNDESIGLPKGLHNVKESLSKSLTSTDILSDYVKHKYSNMEFWHKNSLMKIKGKDF